MVLPILVIIAFGLALFYILTTTKRPYNYPPGPKWLPLVGNTYQLKKLAQLVGGQHLVFEKWCEEYESPILGLKLGNQYMVVVTTYPLVREIHTREEFQGRPDNFFLRLRTMGTRLGITCTDGPLWSEQRNFATRHLRQAGYGRVPMEMKIQNELNDLLAHISDYGEEAVWPGSFLSPNVINVLWTFVAGKRLQRNDHRLKRLLQLLLQRSKAFDMCGGLLSQLPWIRFIAPEKSGYNLLRQFNKDLHEFFMETINEHKKTYEDHKVNDDFIYAFIREMQNRDGLENSTFTDVQLTMTILDMFIAGSQTTSNTLDLALMTMIICPDIQEKVFEEISQKLGPGKLPSANDRTLLPYTQSVLMEVQRFYHIAPLSGPRRCLQQTTLHGYTIPKNATILIGLKTVHMDKEYWKSPELFIPERFLTTENQLIAHDYFMPFGQGKRRCLGDSLARACLFTFFVGIMQNFKLSLPKNATLPSTKLLPGIILTPNPYKIVFTKR